ncbi:MAG TPA: N-acetylneuraminate synthase family protein [Thermoanaerobaculia bacterium]|jgi:N-acetylneuraminate synthase
MTTQIEIAGRRVGDGEPCYVVAEIGINHNGDLDLARRLVRAAAEAGCDAVKLQKRTPELCVPEAQKALPRETPWGVMSYLEYRRRLELGPDELRAVDACCREHAVAWFASCWDEESVDVIEAFDPPCYKIASASLTDDALLRRHRRTGRPLILSTGMSTLAEIDHAVEVLGRDDLLLLHCTSTYPARLEELNLRAMAALRERYGVPVGYSGHEVGLATTVAAAALGAAMIERHITLDRAMWGTDQAASIEPHGFARLVRDVRAVERAMGDGVKRVYESEIPVREKLRRVAGGGAEG